MRNSAGTKPRHAKHPGRALASCAGIFAAKLNLWHSVFVGHRVTVLPNEGKNLTYNYHFSGILKLTETTGNEFKGHVMFPPIRMDPPTEVDGYMGVARELLQGVKALSTVSNIAPRAAAMIAAHALECALKAFLCHKGKKTDIREHKVQHDLLALWGMAYKEGLGIQQAPPDWCRILSTGHGPNFYFRYQEGEKNTVVNFGATPQLIPMADGLRGLIEVVAHEVKR